MELLVLVVQRVLVVLAVHGLVERKEQLVRRSLEVSYTPEVWSATTQVPHCSMCTRPLM
jgi:hypothetical protein